MKRGDHIFVLTGAGISAEAVSPFFRGPTGADTAIMSWRILKPGSAIRDWFGSITLIAARLPAARSPMRRTTRWLSLKSLPSPAAFCYAPRMLMACTRLLDQKKSSTSMASCLRAVALRSAAKRLSPTGRLILLMICRAAAAEHCCARMSAGSASSLISLIAYTRRWSGAMCLLPLAPQALCSRWPAL